MWSEAFTWSEMEAFRLLYGRNLLTQSVDIHGAADQIILLAEKIKAERATAAMVWAGRV